MEPSGTPSVEAEVNFSFDVVDAERVEGIFKKDVKQYYAGKRRGRVYMILEVKWVFDVLREPASDVRTSASAFSRKQFPPAMKVT